jgi:hypothetical protein
MKDVVLCSIYNALILFRNLQKMFLTWGNVTVSKNVTHKVPPSGFLYYNMSNPTPSPERAPPIRKWKEVTFQRDDDDDVCFVLDQHG